MADVAIGAEQVDNPGGGGLSGPTYTALDNVDTYYLPIGDNVIWHFKNTNAGAATITVVTPGTPGGVAITDPTITVPATTGDVMVSPTPADLYKTATGTYRGQGQLTCDLATGVTVAVVQV